MQGGLLKRFFRGPFLEKGSKKRVLSNNRPLRQAGSARGHGSAPGGAANNRCLYREPGSPGGQKCCLFRANTFPDGIIRLLLEQPPTAIAEWAIAARRAGEAS